MRFKKGLALSLVGVVVFAQSISGLTAYAAQITSRSLTLQAGASDGGSKPGGNVKHLFTFTLPGGSNVGSISFTYCTTASGSCLLPTGLVTTGTSLTSQSGATGFTINNTANGVPYITRTAASVAANTAVSYQLSGVVNPTTANTTFFVRIASFISIDTSGGSTDTGTVAASTATPIVLSGTMPESLIFCTGGSITAVSTVPNCSSATSGAISFNQLFSPTDTATASSQMAASTNAGTGYAITVNGPTLTSGSNTIPAMNTAATIVRGTGQFGMNLKLNTTATSTTPVGAEVASAPDGINYKGQATAGYNTVDTFKFTSGDTVANSGNGGLGPSNGQIFTVSYIVNVAGNQASGTYTSTLTYICTATF